MPEPIAPALMNLKQLAAYLGYNSTDAIYRQARKPDFPFTCYLYQGRRMVRREDVDAYIANLPVKAPPEPEPED